MCKVMRVSRSGYYAWLKRPPSKLKLENERLTSMIKEIYYNSRCTYGSPRISRELNRRGSYASRKRVAKLMKAAHLRSKLKRKYVVTTDSKHHFKMSPNILNREFQPGRINRAWVSDITYIHTNQGWLYLTTLIDLGDRRVIGWSLSKSMHARFTSIAAWKMALINRGTSPGLIFHSDQGIQYACDEFREGLSREVGIIQSMSRKGNCWDNAVAESFFKSLKSEWLKEVKFKTRKQAEMAVFQYIEICTIGKDYTQLWAIQHQKSTQKSITTYH
ncbi:UNVERIFIED_CONTAM: hypothetical protein GTU68_012564 [Idotea baltica]|nr:hypothetical protein [Idotea baltica]